MEASQQSLHQLLHWLCSQKEAPPQQSLQWLLRRPCSQKLESPRSLCIGPSVCCARRRRLPRILCMCASVIAARCGLRLVAGGGGWCWCGAAAHATRSVTACIRGPPSSTSASTSGLSRPVLPRQLWRVVGWVGFLSDVISGVESALWEGSYPALTLHQRVRRIEHHDRCL
jgi:hypothetical protein